MFSIKKRFFRSEVLAGDFSEKQEAEDFIQVKLLEDRNLKIKADYCLYDDIGDLVKVFTEQDIIPPSASVDSGSSSQQQSSSQVFNPTPLSITPRPGGILQNWKEVKKEDKDQE